MTEIRPFRAYRYTPQAGPIEKLVTQPYDKISPEMQAQYLQASPHNFVRIILGEKLPEDSAGSNVYTRAAQSLAEWKAAGVLAQDPEPGFYPYFQEFTVPDSGERATRKGLICLGPAVDYEAGVVHRHEQTLSGPKQDRLELLRHISAHTGQLFFLYSDPAAAVDTMLDEAALSAPLIEATDEYDVIHRMWRITDPERTASISRLMEDKKLLIADGHHRYETALAYRDENPGNAAARHVMMTLVNMDSPGLKILATHRLVHSLPTFDTAALIGKAAARFRVTEGINEAELRARLAEPDVAVVRIGLATGDRLCLFESDREGDELDVAVLHRVVLGELLGIDEEAVREQKHTLYQRGIDAAINEARSGRVQAALLLAPPSVQHVADISFAGGVMPQKSTDFYPKLLSGLALYQM